jgi:hypothetical protein
MRQRERERDERARERNLCVGHAISDDIIMPYPIMPYPMILYDTNTYINTYFSMYAHYITLQSLKKK